MDGNTVLIIVVVVVLALLALAGMILYRQRGDVNFKLFGIEFGFRGENPAPEKVDSPAPAHNAPVGDVQPAVNVKDAEADDDILAADETGRGANVERVKTKGGIIATSKNPDDTPKA